MQPAINAEIITTVATPDSHPDCRAPLSQIVALQLPVSHFRMVRDLEKVISLIQTHALLHFCSGHREQDAEGRVIATLEDYAAVRELIEGTLAHGVEVAVPDSIREIVEAVTALATKDKPTGETMAWEEFQGVSQIKLAELLGRDISVISRNVRKAIDEGYLIDENAGQGRVSRLFPGERKLPSGRVLPLPEELCEAGSPEKEVDGGLHEALAMMEVDEHEDEGNLMPF